MNLTFKLHGLFFLGFKKVNAMNIFWSASGDFFDPSIPEYHISEVIALDKADVICDPAAL
jgi:hypothetical protein